MAYRAPFFVAHHALRTAGASAVTITGGDPGAFPTRRLFDSRHDALFRFATSAANHAVTVDRGTGSLAALDRLVIPSGHNLGTAQMQVHDSATGAFAGEETLRHSAVAVAGLVDQAFSVSAATARYVRWRVVSSGQWELPELVLSVTRTPTVGPNPQYRDDQVPTSSETVLRSGNAYRLQLGDDRRRLAVTWEGVPVSEVSSLFDVVWTESGQGIYPVWYGGADSSQAILPVLFADEIERRQASAVPVTSGLYFDVSAQLIEALS